MTFNDLKLRVRALLRPTRVEQELDEELAFHIEREATKLAGDGMAPAQARARAQARFGSTALAADRCRDERGTALDRQHHSRRSVCAAHLHQGAARRLHRRRHGGGRTRRGRGAVHRPQYAHLPRRSGAGHRRDVRGRAAPGGQRRPLAADASDVRRDASRHAGLHGRLRRPCPTSIFTSTAGRWRSPSSPGTSSRSSASTRSSAAPSCRPMTCAPAANPVDGAERQGVGPAFQAGPERARPDRARQRRAVRDHRRHRGWIPRPRGGRPRRVGAVVAARRSFVRPIAAAKTVPAWRSSAGCDRVCRGTSARAQLAAWDSQPGGEHRRPSSNQPRPAARGEAPSRSRSKPSRSSPRSSSPSV